MKRYRIEVDAVAEYQVGRVSYYSGIAKLSGFTEVTLDANLRRPKKNTTTFKEIQQSLREDPDKFLGRNQGVRITAEKAQYAYNAIGQIEAIILTAIDEVHGLQNGGHTVQACADLIEKGISIKEPRVFFGITVGEKDEENNLACRTLNTASKVDSRSIANKGGLFDVLKPFFASHGLKNIAYYDGQPGVPSDGRCNVNHLITLANVLYKESWDYTVGKHPFNVIKGGKGYPKEIIQMIPNELAEVFLNAFRLEVRVYNELVDFAYKKKGFGRIPGLSEPKSADQYVRLADKSSYPVSIPPNFAFPLISGMRPYISGGKWELSIEHEKELFPKMWNRYIQYLKQQKSQGNLSQAISRTDIWQDLCWIAAEFRRVKAEESQQREVA